MRKILCTILCVAMLACMCACNGGGKYELLPVVQTDRAVDTQAIDSFLLENPSFPEYKYKKEETPTLLSCLVDVTPEQLAQKCAIYRFNTDADFSLIGETFLVFDGEVYRLGCAYMGYGVTEFAYRNGGGNDVLYFTYSWNGATYRSLIGRFDFKTKEMAAYSEPGFQRKDIAFQLSEDGKELAVCQADIQQGTDSVVFGIDKGEVLYEDVTSLEFKVTNSDE